MTMTSQDVIEIAGEMIADHMGNAGSALLAARRRVEQAEYPGTRGAWEAIARRLAAIVDGEAR